MGNSRCMFIVAVALSALLDAKETSLCQDNYKEFIQEIQQQIVTAKPQEHAYLQVQLAIAYFRDQDLEKAFQTFLEGMNSIEKRDEVQISREERILFDKSLEIYLGHHTLHPQEVATKILEVYLPIIKENPQYHQIGFLVASAYANLCQFDHFFDLFYHAYLAFPDHWLAYKSKAMLHVKLFERSRTFEERERERKLILSDVVEGIRRNPRDYSLYKMALAFSQGDDKPKMVNLYLSEIIDRNIIVPRGDVIFYVQQAMQTNQKDLAHRFLNKSQEWYQYSRVINAAKQYLDQHD